VRRAATLALLVALALAGCGGSPDGGDGGSDSADGGPAQSGAGGGEPGASGGEDSGAAGGAGAATGPLTRRELIAAADSVCKRARGRIGRVAARFGRLVADKRLTRPRYYRRAAVLTGRLRDLAQAAARRVRALAERAPRDRHLDGYLRGVAAQVAVFGAQADALRRGEGREVHKLNFRLMAQGKRTRRAARAYGFRVCGGVR
jgi:hypothetical protein